METNLRYGGLPDIEQMRQQKANVMIKNLKLHHCAKRITENSLEFVMDLFEQLGCKESYWKDGARWAMIEQNVSNTIIQFIETDQYPHPTEEKISSHIAFLSSDPQNDISMIKEWICSQNKKIEVGQWSEKELYFDCPEVFIDFVVEIMHESIIEESNKP